MINWYLECAFHLSGLADLKALVLAGVNWKAKVHSSRVRAWELRCLACFQCEKDWKVFCTVVKTPAHFASSPRRSAKTDWRYSKDSSARTMFCQFSEPTRSIYGQDGPTGHFLQMESGLRGRFRVTLINTHWYCHFQLNFADFTNYLY